MARVDSANGTQNTRAPHALKIALVLDKYTPSRGGESYFSGLAEGLTRRGHEVHIFGAVVEREGSTLYQVHRIPVIPFPRFLRMLSYLVTSKWALSSCEFDIIHGVGGVLYMNVFNPHGGVDRAYLKREAASMHRKWYVIYRKARRYLSPHHHVSLWIQDRQYRSDRVKKYIAISEMIKRDITRYYEVKDGRISVIFNGVDTDRFHPKNRDLYRVQKCNELQIDEKTLVLLFVGNNYRLKGVRQLLRALVLLKEWFPTQPLRLLIAGRGRIRPYRRLAQALGVGEDVLFLGPVLEIEKYYAVADIYVHPTFYDSCSLSVLEALASGLPVVTTQFNGAAEAILSEKGGIVIEDPAEIKSLAGALAGYFDSKKRKIARSAAREWAEQHTLTRNLDETIAVYEEVSRKSSS